MRTCAKNEGTRGPGGLDRCRPKCRFFCVELTPEFQSLIFLLDSLGEWGYSPNQFRDVLLSALGKTQRARRELIWGDCRVSKKGKKQQDEKTTRRQDKKTLEWN